MRAFEIVSGIAAVAMLAGCVGASADPDANAGASASEPTYTQTSVVLHPDGTQTVTTRPITLTEELARNAARAAGSGANVSAGLGTAAEAVTVDGSCLLDSFDLFDQLGETGNEICFAGTGVADLSQYLDGLSSTWASTEKSYWSGQYAGFYQEDLTISCALGGGAYPQNPRRCVSFATFTPQSPLGTCESSFHRYLNLDKVCQNPYDIADEDSDPVGSDGYYFYPSGSVKAQVLNGGTVVLTTSGTADATGHVSIGLGNPMTYGTGCGEVLKYTDETSGLTATTNLVKSCF